MVHARPREVPEEPKTEDDYFLEAEHNRDLGSGNMLVTLGQADYPGNISKSGPSRANGQIRP